MMQHAPRAAHLLMPRTTVLLHGRPVRALSFFREGTCPEWEHKSNQAGLTLTHRLRIDPKAATELWTLLTCECARGAVHPAVNGLQLTQRTSRAGAVLARLDVWLRVSDSKTCAHIAADFNRLGTRWRLQLLPVAHRG